MKWIEAKVGFRAENPGLATELISDMFNDLGMKGVVIEDPFREPVEDWAEDAPPPPDHYAVTGYLPDSDRLEGRRRELERRLSELGRMLRVEWWTAYREIDEQDWAESWKAYFNPEKVSERIVIKPTWRDYRAEAGEIVLEIDPGMAFGTGTHPTTALCIQAIERYLRPGHSFLDVGTGSGILMIAAASLGADALHGIDTDEVAVRVAGENLELNGIPAEKYTVRTGHLVSGISETFDIAAANIFSHIIIQLLDPLRRVLKAGGIFIGSGIVSGDEQAVIDKMEECGIQVREIRERDGWICIVGQYGS